MQTTVDFLNTKALGRAFVDVWTDTPKIVKQPQSFAAFKELLKNKKIKKVRRIGKCIVFDLSQGLSLLVHQKLTGHLLYGKWKLINGKWVSRENGAMENDPMNGFIRLVFFLDNGWQIALSDLRKFAKVELWKTSEMQKKLEKEIGPDIFQITCQEFVRRISKKRGPIKKVLMAQEVVSGIGNIYSDEILFEAQIHPLSKTEKLSPEQLENICRTARRILKKALDMKGTSVSDYRTPDGEKGRFGEMLKVYRRRGQPCFRCGAPIEMVRVGGRSAHFCPKCQRLVS